MKDLMAAAPSSPFPKSKTSDVVIPVGDGSGEDESRGKHCHDMAVLRNGQENSPLLAVELEDDQSPMRNSLWREVSADYLRELERSSEEAMTQKRKRRDNAGRRPQSFDFGVSVDPPTKLIENFLQHQAATGTVCLDMDMNMMQKIPAAAIAKDITPLPPAVENSRASESSQHAAIASMRPLEYASQSSSNACNYNQQEKQPAVSRACGESIEQPAGIKNAANGRWRTLGSDRRATFKKDEDGSDSCSDDASVIRRRSVRSSLNRLQTSSRLADKPPSAKHMDPKSRQLKSGPVRSGLLQKSHALGRIEDEEDDPFKDGDIPDGLRGSKLNCLTIFQWISFVLIMGWMVCSLTIPALVKWPLWNMALWKWALLVLLLFCGRLVSGWVVRILVLILERNFLMRKRVLYFVYGLRKGVQNCLWFALAVLEWRLVFDPKVESSTNKKLPYVTKVLNCLLIAAIVWLVKIFFVKVLASSFHVSTYFERIRESLFGQWVLETLSGPPAIEIEQETKLIAEVNDLKKAGATVPEAILPKANTRAPQSGILSMGVSGLLIGGKKSGFMGTGQSGFVGKGGPARSESQRGGHDTGISIDDLHRLNQRNISAWNMKRLMNFVRYRGIYTLAHVIDQTAAQSPNEGQEMEIHSRGQAVSLARKIFKNVAKAGARYIGRDDLLRFMLEPEVNRALPLFEGSEETGRISKTALKSFAVQVVRERRALSLSLNDTKTAVKKLHRIVDVIVGIIILIVSLLVLGITTTHLLVVISSQLLLVVFIFGNTCKMVFEAIIFLFVMHPFDVGDRCVVDGNQLVVEEMNILSTLFVRNTGEKIWYPNTLLATKFIFNYYWTPDTGDSFDFCIDASTPSEMIATLKDKIGKYITSKPDYWTGDFQLLVTSIENSNKMNIQLGVNHTVNFDDDLDRKIRKSELILDVQKMLQDMGLSYNLPPQNVILSHPHDMNKKEGVSSHLKHA